MLPVDLKKMSGIKSEWRRCESRSKPGKFYFFNVTTKISSWKQPSEGDDCHTGEASSAIISNSSEKSLNDQTPSNDRASASKASCQLSVSLPVTRSEKEDEISLTCTEEVDHQGTITEVSSVASEFNEELQLMVNSRVSALRNTNFELTPVLDHLPTFQILPAQYQHPLYIVVETSVLLSHLQMIKELKSGPIQEVDHHVLLFPWAVLQELDMFISDEKVSKEATRAVNFLHDSINHPRMLFQTYKEATNVHFNNTSCSEDHIIQCCVDYQSKVKSHGGLVILFHNMIDICVAAMGAGVRSLNEKTLLSELPVIWRYNQHTKLPQGPVTSGSSKKVQMSCVENLLYECENIISIALSSIIQKEMKEAFDNLWVRVVAVKPPWTFANVIGVIDRHWVAVFGLVVPRSLKRSCLDKLVSHANSRPRVFIPWKCVESFVHYSKMLLSAFSEYDSYDGIVQCSLSYLDNVSVCIKDIKSGQIFRAPQMKVINPTVMPAPKPSILVPSPKAVISCEEDLKELAKKVPAQSSEKLPWVLNLVLQTAKFFVYRVKVALKSPDEKISLRISPTFISQLISVLEKIVFSLRVLIENELSIPSMREFVVATDSFLHTCLDLDCPLNLDTLYHTVSQHQQSQVLKTALEDCTLYCKTLKQLYLN